jgi:hypothetical protein
LNINTNIFLKNNIVQNKDDVYELKGYEKRGEETDEGDDEKKDPF